MTEKQTNLSEKGSRCRICTGCGRCFGKKKMDAVSAFCVEEGISCESAAGSVAERRERERLCALEREKARRGGEVAAGQEDFLCVVDIGTTTVAMQLRSLQDGKVFDTFTCLNPQGKYGADVLSRIGAAENPQTKKAMYREIREVLNTGILQFQKTLDRLCLHPEKKGIEKASLLPKQEGAGEVALSGRDKETRKLCGIVIAANTTMVHLLMDLDVSLLGKYPFQPETLSEIHTSLFEIPAVILPGISAFVGADISAGIYALSMHERQEVTLLLDLGTNGEMVLGNRERMIATAAAAGPAFEGNAENYGTDLMALAARLLEEGILDETGLLAEPYFEEGIDIGGVRLTQSYIRQLQMAKAAVRTGIRILCEKYGLESPAQIDKVFLAGGMGYYLSSEAAARIGLLPAELAGKTVAVGNAALEGAFWYGRRILWQEISAEGENTAAGKPLQTGIISAAGILPPLRTEVFNLAEEPQFSERYVQEMNFPAAGES